MCGGKTIRMRIFGITVNVSAKFSPVHKCLCYFTQLHVKTIIKMAVGSGDSFSVRQVMRKCLRATWNTEITTQRRYIFKDYVCTNVRVLERLIEW